MSGAEERDAVMSSQEQSGKTVDGDPQTVGFAPFWGIIFLAIGFAVSIPIGLIIRLTTGLSASSDIVFGAEALLSGIISDLILKHGLHRKLVLWEPLKVSFIWIWIALCLYVMLAQPF
jgi:hypothetical protein